jgi:hypothetical protein
LRHLSESLYNAQSYLPSRESKRYVDSIGSLEEMLEKRRQLLSPSKKFTFSSFEKPISSPSSKNLLPFIPVTIQEENTLSNSFTPSSSSLYSIQHQSFKEIHLAMNDVFEKQVVLSHLHHCTIEIDAPFYTLQLDHLEHCTIKSGPVFNSILIRNCRSCDCQLASHQLRIHESQDLSLHIHVSTSPIIEACYAIQFTTYSFNYTDCREHFKVKKKFFFLHILLFYESEFHIYFFSLDDRSFRQTKLLESS